MLPGDAMRFQRYGHFEFRDTDRKRAAFLRKQKAEREALPLFADQVAAAQIGVDEEMQARRHQWERDLSRSRQRQADKWREARRRIRTYPEPVRVALLGYWQACCWPGDPVYFLSMLHMYDHGRLQLDVPALTQE